MNRIRELRKQLDMTKKELAKHLQIADSTLSYWEMGRYEPDNEALIKLSRFFKVPIDYILGGDFMKWDINGDNTPYHSVNTSYLAADMSVSEANVPYKKTIASNPTNGYHDVQTAFDRIEFHGLTQVEIDVLAEYAEFIKSRRKNST